MPGISHVRLIILYKFYRQRRKIQIWDPTHQIQRGLLQYVKDPVKEKKVDNSGKVKVLRGTREEGVTIIKHALLSLKRTGLITAVFTGILLFTGCRSGSYLKRAKDSDSLKSKVHKEIMWCLTLV